MSGITRLVQNEKFYTIAKGAAGAIYATTALKAIARPAIIYADKTSDAETKKYTAGKEFLYQALCLLITVGLLPVFKVGGFKLASKHLKKIPQLSEIKTNLKGLGKFEKEMKDASMHNKNGYSKSELDNMKLVNGGVELGSFVGSVLGLTIIAPIISHKILHPIMKAMKLEKSDDKNIGRPKEIFLADAKTDEQKLNTKI